MRQTGGGSWVCLALLGLVACSSPSAPPAEGSVQITWTNGCSTSPATISGPGGLPSGSKVGANQTVLDGRDGYKVGCTVSRSGSTYSVSASIELPDDISLTVDGSGITFNGRKGDHVVLFTGIDQHFYKSTGRLHPDDYVNHYGTDDYAREHLGNL